MKKRSIEGYWLGGYYMPPSLYFYANLGTIQLNKGESNVKKFDRPWLRDLEWLIFRYYTAIRGFSGFELDDEYSSHMALLNPELDDETLFTLYPSTKRLDGTRKEFISPMSNLEMRHPYSKGRALFYNQAWNGMMMGSRDTGKALWNFERVYTESGEKFMEDVTVGDKIYGADGKLTTITAVHPQGKIQLYKVSFRDGRYVHACENHLWTVYKRGKLVTVSTKEMMSDLCSKREKTYKVSSGKECNYFLPKSDPIEFPKKNLPIDPYTLGVLLGDGSLTQAISITTADKELLEYIPYKTTKWKSKYAYGVEGLSENIKALKLNSRSEFKFIPEIYKRSSVEQRLELIRGLMDTDGSCDKNGFIEFSSSSFQLAYDTLEVLRSLGIICSIKKRETKRLDNYRIFILTSEPIFKLKRKLNRLKSKSTHKKTAITSIEPSFIDDATCVEVDNEDRLFLTSNYIPTHNSYSVGVGMALKEWLFDGATVYNEESITHPSAVDITVGAEDSQKSSLMMTKMKIALERLPGSRIINGRLYPSPISKQYQGSWIVGKQIVAEYQKKYPGGWKTVGSQSVLKHRSFKDNPFADQGARNLLIVLEEIGMFNLLKQVFYNTRDNLQDGDRKIGSLFMLGTGGDMEAGGTEDSRDMFYNPEVFDILYFDDIWENRGHIALFVPATMAVNRFKDERGFTDMEKATKYWLQKRESARTSSKGSDVLSKLMQYRPLVPSEIFLSRESSVFPSVELQKRLSDVRDNKIYDLLEKRVELFFDPKSIYNGVDYKINDRLTAINEHPWKHDNVEGATVIYELPHLIDDRVPQGAYVIGCDAFKDNANGGSSFAAIYVMKTSKYPTVVGYEEIVASYIGRPYMGMSEVCETLYKLSLFYGNATIYFENTAGNIKGYFEKIRRLDLLAAQPTSVLNRRSSQATTSSSVIYGYPMSNDKIKWEALQYARTWLLQERESGTNITKRNLDLIPDPYLLQQLISFNLDGNFDAVMGFIGCIIGLEELHAKSRSKEEQEQYSSLDQEFVKVFSINKHLFK